MEAAVWTRRRAAPPYAPIPNLTCLDMNTLVQVICSLFFVFPQSSWPPLLIPASFPRSHCAMCLGSVAPSDEISQNDYISDFCPCS